MSFGKIFAGAGAGVASGAGVGVLFGFLFLLFKVICVVLMWVFCLLESLLLLLRGSKMLSITCTMDSYAGMSAAEILVSESTFLRKMFFFY